MLKNLKISIVFIAIVVVLCIGLISCTPTPANTTEENPVQDESNNTTQDSSSLQTELDNWVADHLELKEKVDSMSKEMVTIKSEIKTLQNLVDDLIEEKPIEGSADPEESSTYDEVFDNFRESIRVVIEDEFGAQLTKFTLDDELGIIYLAYNTKWAGDDMTNKEMYEIVSGFAKAGIDYSLDVNVTEAMGDTIHTYTTSDNMKKIKNFELSYSEWLEEAF